MNTYERVAWVVVATRLLVEHPFGYGVIHNAFGRLVKLKKPNSDLTLCHSGWLDLGMSFGFIGLGLVLGSLLWTIAMSLYTSSDLDVNIFWIGSGLVLVYLFLEIFYYHGVEILFFWLVFLPSLMIPSPEKE